MSRAKYLTLITWLSRSASARRFFFVFPFILAATTAHAPVVKSALIAQVPDAPTAKKAEPPLDWSANRKNVPDKISLFHSSPIDPPDDSPLVLRDTADFKPISSSRDFQPVIVPTVPIAITNDPPTAQPVTQFTPTGVSDGGLVSREFDTPDAGFVGGGGGGSGADFTLDDPISTGGGGGSDRGTPSVGTAVPEPTCVWLLPAATILLRRRKIACI